MNAILHIYNPVHISGGENTIYSPYKDYIIEEKKKTKYIIFIDSKKFFQYIEKDSKSIDEFVKNLIVNFSNGTSTYDLKEFLHDKKIPIEKVEKYRELLYEEKEDARKEIMGFISAPCGKYIPGSSIKGAIRTALIYKYLKRRVSIKNRLYRNVLNSSDIRPKGVFERNISLRSLKTYFRGLQVGDTKLLGIDNFFVGDVKIFHFKDKGNSDKFSVRWEFLKPGREINVKIKLTKNIAFNIEDDFWQFIPMEDYKILFKYINEFALDFILHEIKELNWYQKHTNSNENIIYVDGMLKSYKKLVKIIEEKKEREAFMLLGAGTSFFSKTIDMIFSEKEMEAIRDKFKDTSRNGKVISMGIKKGGKSNPFPITRSIITTEEESKLMGWVSIRLKEE